MTKKIHDKIMKAHCPLGIVNGNPVLELVRHIIFHQFSEFVVERPSKWEGIWHTMTIMSWKWALSKKIHPADLKKATAFYINKIVDPYENTSRENASDN